MRGLLQFKYLKIIYKTTKIYYKKITNDKDNWFLFSDHCTDVTRGQFRPFLGHEKE